MCVAEKTKVWMLGRVQKQLWNKEGGREVVPGEKMSEIINEGKERRM